LASKDINGIMLNFYGDGPNLQFLEDLVLKLNLNHMVKFHGYTNEIPRILYSTDVFVLISNWEGFPISTLEAMSMGKPIIVSNVGGACECLEDGVNGYKVERKSIEQIKNAIKKFVDHKDLIELMGKESRAIYLRDYTIEKMINETVSTYKEVILR
jgi:glycosyltransferase involved in cell wall biosynthesis